MEDPEQLSQVDQSQLNSLLGGAGGSLIPESLVTTLTVSFILLNVLAVLLTVLYIINVVRKWKVQSAVLHMQKDVAEIKQHLAIQAPAPSVEPVKANVSEPNSEAAEDSTDRES